MKNRGRLGPDLDEVRKIDTLGRIIEYTDEGVTRSGYPRHQKLLEDYFGMDNSTTVLNKNGYDEDGQSEQDDDNDDLTTTECLPHASGEIKLHGTSLLVVAVWLQFSAKEICRSMANPKANDFMKDQAGGEVPEEHRRGQVQVCG